MESLYEHAGGRARLRTFIDLFYSSVLADELLQPLFGAGRPEHVDQLTAFDAESFGGPDDFSRTMGGFPHLIDVHRGLRISEEQRRRFVQRASRTARAGRTAQAPEPITMPRHISSVVPSPQTT